MATLNESNPVLFEDPYAKDTTDDRRNKYYDRIVFFGALAWVPHHDRQHSRTPSPTDVQERFHRKLKRLTDQEVESAFGCPVTFRTSSSGWGFWSHREHEAENGSLSRMSWHVKLRVSKPSLIPDEETALRWAEEVGLPILRKAYAEAFAARAEYVRRLIAAEEATHLSKTFAKRAVNEARDVCRYEARLAALRAELEVEVQTQVEKMADKVREAIESSDNDWEPEAAEYAIEHFGEFTDEYLSSFPFRGHGPQVKVSDLFPEPEEADDEKGAA